MMKLTVLPESNAGIVWWRRASPQHTAGEQNVALAWQIKNLDAEPVLWWVNWIMFYWNHEAASMRSAFIWLFSVLMAGNKQSNRSELFFLSFSRTNPPPPWMVRVKLQSRGVAGLRHVFPWKSSEGNGMAACGVMVCNPYNCREADWLAQAELLLLRCVTTGSLEWGPVGCTHSSISPRHSPLWPWSRQTQSYAGWRWGFVPTVSTVEPIFLRKQISDIWVHARCW